MNKEFKILWFEDNEDWRKPIEYQIKKTLSSKYLQPVITPLKKGSSFNLNDIEKNNYDLILVDNYLLDDPKGSDLVTKIRTNKIYTDILFYSSKYNDLVEFLKKVLSDDINGIYISKRDNELFIEKVNKLIDKNIRRTENIINFRGIITESTSEFEKIAHDKIAELYNNLSDENKKQLDSIVTDKIFDPYINGLIKTAEDYRQGNINFLDYNDRDQGLSMNQRLIIFNELLKTITGEEFKIEGFELKDFYMRKIGTYRNRLNHLNIGTTITVYGETETINQDFYQKLRENIKYLNDNLSKIFDELINKMKTQGKHE